MKGEDWESQSSSPNEDLRKLAPEGSPLKLPSPAEQIVRVPEERRSVGRQDGRQQGWKGGRGRLVIERMVLQNFKSYAGKQVIGPFHTNFTSVVGPNGSGKSNLIESMLFIFGFSASWMRLNKLSQLIHHSSNVPDAGRASVEVHFHRLADTCDGGTVSIPGTQFFVRRTVSGASSSKYFWSGRECTQGEVKDRLKAEGIDLTCNRFLILQGEVEQISQMRQKSGDRDKPGLLEYLEQIIGSGVFVQKIEECARQWSLAEEQKHEKGSLMRLAEQEIKGLSKAKQQAVRFVKKERKIYQLQNVVNQILVRGAKNKLQNLSNQLTELERAKDRIIGQERERLKKQGERIREIRANKNEMDEVVRKLQKIQQQCNKLQAQDKHINQQVAFKSEDLVKYERRLDEIDKQLSKIISQTEQIKKKLPTSSQFLKNKTQKLESMKTQLSKMEKPHLRQGIQQLESDIQKVDLQISTLRRKLDSVKDQRKKIQGGTADIEIKIKQYQTRLEESREVKSKIVMARTVAERICKQRGEKISELNAKREELRREGMNVDQALRETTDANEEAGQMGSLFKEVMRQGIRGVLGRLGDLGEVPKEYDEVVSTCCGKLDNIVVLDYEAASGVVQFLKRGRLGRATCIILDKINEQKNYMVKSFSPPPGSVRLFDIITPRSEQARLAFYFALGDTLYCQDSDRGLQLAWKNDQQRKRVVSRNKNGQGFITYQMNGLMVGAAPKRGGFLTKGGKAKIKDEGSIKQLQSRKKVISSKIEEISKRLVQEEGELKTAKQDLQQMARELISVEENIRQFQQQLKELREMIQKGSKSNAGGMDRQIDSLEKEIKNNEAKRRQLEGRLKKLQDEARETEGETVVNLRQQVRKEKAEVAKLQKEFQREKTILQGAPSRVEANKKSRIEIEKSIERWRRDIDKLKGEQLALQRQVSQYFGKMAGFEERLRDCKKKDGELKMIMEEDEKQLRQSKQRVQKAKKDLEQCQQGCKRQSEEVRFAQSELDRIRQNYRQMSSSYDFLDFLEEVQKMGVDGKNPDNRIQRQGGLSPRNSSFLENSLLNSSIESVNAPRIFPMERLLNSNPCKNFDEDDLSQWQIFRDKLMGMVASQTAILKKLDGSNLQVINEFKAKWVNWRQRVQEFQAVRQRQLELKRLMDGLKEDRLKLFREGFGVINAKLKQVYQHLTRGGDAELQLIDALDPFSDGVNFSVRPPKKSWKEVNKLSGGEKTLSSLSLIFALHYYKPTPLYFMDEIDAALDFKNVSIVAQYIKKRTRDAQFIIISLRNNMFDLANKLIGVYKTHDQTRAISLVPSKLLAMRAQKDKSNEENAENQQIRQNDPKRSRGGI